MKTLLQINSVVNTGSTGRIAEDIGNIAIENGWKSYIAYGRYGNASKSNLIKIGSKFDNYIHVIYTRLLDRHGYSSRRATKKFIKQVEKINPDVIHLHNIHGYYINIDILFDYLAKKSIPVVWTLHDCWAFTGHCTHYTYVNCLKWETHCVRCPQIRSYPESFIDNSFSNFDLKRKLFNSLKILTLVPVSKWLEREISKSFLKTITRKQIYNGIDVDVFRPQDFSEIETRLNLKNKFVILGVASNWEARKGLDDFIRLSKLTLEDDIIILIGLSKFQIRNLPGNIIGIEKTEDIRELVEFYSRADVFFNASLEETFGLVIAEALACGTPAIVYDATACPELINNKETGFIVDAGNINGVLSAINDVKVNGKLEYSKNCRREALKHFHKSDRYKEYFELYNHLNIIE